MKRIGICLLCVLLLLGCAANAEPEEIKIDSATVIVSGEDTMAAALSLQTTIAQQWDLDLEIKEQAEEGTAIVIAVEESLNQGQYRTRIEEGSIYIEAQNSDVMVQAMRSIRRAWPVADSTPHLLASQCDQLSGTIDLQNAPVLVLTQNIRYADDEGGNKVVDRAPRFKLLAQEYLPDIIAIQEDSKLWAGILDKFLGENYNMSGMFSSGPEDTRGNRQSIFYNKDRFEAVEEGAFILSDTPDEFYTRFEGSKSVRHITWVLLKDRFTGKELLLCNTHLDNSTDEIRDKQLAVVLDRLGSYMEQYPTVFVGDFNATPDSSVYTTMSGLMSDPHVSATTKLSNQEITCDKYGLWETPKRIDYMFYNDKLVADTYRIMTDLYDGYISDHYGVTTQYSYLP